ncbi:m-AAA protease-interacting protein 1, mitochondrial [Plectropomus leopardus]|uniref:m-AAA protease-interacting protein 1, mitochondrial n=1 Tax=Plectropomus leopardus TaxID=160734 RepID=UPI001C4AAD26|nr:m-AAA protease-interacting protein 1, mitochondrial [Plectropomus leopardus]
MSLPMLRGCSKFPSTFSFTRLFLNESIVLNRSGKTRLSSPCPGAVAAAARPYSSERGGNRHSQSLVVVGIPNPFIWFRTRIYYFLIRTYFDKDFSIEEFTEGAKQAFSHVSKLLSQCRFEALEGLVATDLVGKLEEKCNLLPSSHKKALSADPEEIVYTIPGDVGIYYDDNGRKFVSILMRFWYLTSANLPDDFMEGSRDIQMASREGELETKRLLTANYEFQREFTKGVTPDWTIVRIEHSKLLG